jgi:hypothetical protein
MQGKSEVGAVQLPWLISQQAPSTICQPGRWAILISLDQLILQMTTALADSSWSRRITQLIPVNSKNHEK